MDNQQFLRLVQNHQAVLYPVPDNFYEAEVLHFFHLHQEAIRRSGLELKTESIRGGTDGSRLSFMGLPCPNLFAGEQAIHSKLEFISVQDMNKAVETIVHLAGIWEEKATTK